MDNRVQKILDNANTVDGQDAVNKARESYWGTIPFENYMNTINTILWQFRYSHSINYAPSAEQYRMICSTSPRQVVIAAAGSGKTRTLTIKIFLRKELNKWDANDILIITFTRNSAQDMERQYKALSRALDAKEEVDFKTIHKFGLDFIKLLDPYKLIITEDNPVVTYEFDPDLGEQVEIKHTIHGLIQESINLCQYHDKNITPKQLYSIFSVLNEKIITDDKSFREADESFLNFPLTYEEIVKVRDAYMSKKNSLNCIDYNDMLLVIHEILSNLPSIDLIPQEIVRKYLTFKAIYIDEVQDVSPRQISIILELLRLNPDAELCCVGDDDQSIYGFRGSSPEFLLKFPELFAPKPKYKTVTRLEDVVVGIDEDGDEIVEQQEIVEEVLDETPVREPVEVIYMTTNRRSAPIIINVANHIISNNKNRYNKLMRPMNSFDGQVKVIQDYGRMVSTGTIMNKIKEQYGENVGYLGNIGILYREHKQIIPILGELVNNRIPFNCSLPTYSELYPHNMKITKDIIGIINMVLDLQNPFLVSKHLHKICPSISTKGANEISSTISNELSKPQAKRLKFSSILKSNKLWAEELPHLLNIYNLIQKGESIGIIVDTIYDRYCKAYLQRMIESAPALEAQIKPSMGYLKYKPDITWETFNYEHARLGKWIEQNSSVVNGVQLCTFHVAKGLEFDDVYILEVSNIYTPKDEVLSRYSEEAKNRYIEEERRLFYVAITRAKINCTVFSGPSAEEKNIFIEELKKAIEIEEKKLVS